MALCPRGLFSIWLFIGFLSLGSSQNATLSLDSENCVNNSNIGENILQSTNGMFALKFFKPIEKSLYLVIAYIQYNQTIVWTANRNIPIRGKPCLKLGLQADLVLQDTDNSVVWSANISQADHLELQTSGNLVLKNSRNVTIWASFDHPTDTIIEGGYLGPGQALVSSKSQTELSEGPYMLKMEPGGVVWYGSFPFPLPYGAWTFNPLGFESSSSLNIALHSSCNKTRLGYGSNGESITLIQEGNLTAACMQEIKGLGSTTRNIITGAQLGDDIFRFMRLDVDGNLRTYIQSPFKQFPDTDIFSIFLQDVCKLPNICGPLGICSPGGICKCENENIFEQSQSKLGCIPRKMSICGASNQLVELEGIDYFANPYMQQSISTLEECKNSCVSNCSCAAAFFWGNSKACYHYQEVKSLRNVSDQSITAFIKVGPGSFSDSSKTNDSKRKTIVLAILVPTVCIVFATALSLFCIRYKRKKSENSEQLRSEEDEFLENLPGLPPRFSYKEMEEATQGFSTMLGSGGFGGVFEGHLRDGRKVAVKKLGNADRGNLQFRAEVAALGSINHVNLVRLFGFCADGTNRLLVYECMSNSSLDRWLFRQSHESSLFLGWKKRYTIIHDTARGLEFLHEKSRNRILHLDVKPQNILLDENFRAKLADFGLAKLLDRSNSRAYTRIRGTPGYLAPEWLLNASATEKSDVFSFGMVLLEIISGRKNLDLSYPEGMEFFPKWAVNMIEEGKITDVADPELRYLADYNGEEAEQVIKIAFWCIQEDEKIRPTMKEVILMLEGHIEIEEPPFSMQFLSRTHISIKSHFFDSGTSGSNAATFSMTLSAR
ncbi:G-type lectin S-receptor-like serine/threonine-protein kinase SD2-5 [Cryptomeria japonica]|uniref:G-type lectin S-receptor-like serine/threonine-protein kinase SD2-5 n=1 Tax=Cryptomeria japonica TaxID=3369 RepID=UPI0025AC4EDD|nr:G-type lectin S-receptor-like serine/threonine-protein kinase SD2-5 [Cryptomeria japonica]